MKAETEDNGRFLLCQDGSGTVLARYRWAEILGYVAEDGAQTFEQLLSEESAPGAVLNLTAAVTIALEHVAVEATEKWTVCLGQGRREVARFRSGAIIGYRVEPEAPLLALYRNIRELERPK